MKFILRLLLTFLLAPLLGALIANIPSSLFISLTAENNGGGFGSYGFLIFATLVYAYPMMLLGIVFAALYARKKYKWYRYALMGMFLGVFAGFPLIIIMAEKEALAAGFLFAMIANGVCIAIASYFLMGRTDRAPERVD